MKESLEAFIVKELGGRPADLNRVVDQFDELRTRKNEVLLDAGEICHKVFFIVKGCLKVSSYNYNGDESTIDLAFENEWRTAMRSFVNQQASNERIMTAEPSDLLYINRESFEMLSQEVPQFELIYKKLLEDSYSQSVERVQSLMSMDALNRVKWLLHQHPFIFTRLSNRLIASYLSLSEATLSRLKAKL
ncbi:MAG: Crp/Fnr family transcriptional regulator [Bacteroidia bacterium]|nr:Crp/Fnr family transcriptional regulator [Bacteroidia bacterium]